MVGSGSIPFRPTIPDMLPAGSPIFGPDGSSWEAVWLELGVELSSSRMAQLHQRLQSRSTRKERPSWRVGLPSVHPPLVGQGTGVPTSSASSSDTTSVTQYWNTRGAQKRCTAEVNRWSGGGARPKTPTGTVGRQGMPPDSRWLPPRVRRPLVANPG